MKEESLSTKEMLSGIGSMQKKALELTKQNNAYAGLLKHILSTDYYNDDEVPFPTLKGLCEISGLSTSRVRKFIGQIYYDLVLDYERRPVFSFSNIRYEFLIRGSNKKFITMGVDRLPWLPRKGEEISIPFYYAYLGEAHFYVEEINHVFKEEAQIVKIWLRPGSFNTYWQYRKDKAVEENEISFRDWFDLEENEIKRKLKIGIYK